MRNKSRKRMLHEQRVEIEYLRRMLRTRIPHCATSESRANIVTIKNEIFVPSRDVPGKQELIARKAYETIKGIERELVKLLEIHEAPSYGEPYVAPSCGTPYKKVTITLRAIAPPAGSQLVEDFVNSASKVHIKDRLQTDYGFGRGNWYEDQICYGGPHEGGRRFAERLSTEYKRLSDSIDQAIFELNIPKLFLPKLSLPEDFNDENKENEE